MIKKTINLYNQPKVNGITRYHLSAPTCEWIRQRLEDEPPALRFGVLSDNEMFDLLETIDTVINQETKYQ